MRSVDDGSLAGQLAGSLDHPVIRSGPVPAPTRKYHNLALVNDDQGAIAVMLDLVNPALASGGLAERRGNCGDMNEGIVVKESSPLKENATM
jgi:hypothetical protein